MQLPEAPQVPRGHPEWPAPAWEARFRAGYVSVPEWALAAPERAVVVATHQGVRQVHSWDSTTRALIPTTDRPHGTVTATIDPRGEWIWWFDDDGGDEFGVWRRQPFASGPRRRTETPLPLTAAYSAGLLLGEDKTVVVGRSDDAYGTQIHQLVVGPAGAGDTAPVLLYAHAQDASAAALSRDANLVAIEHSERGDNRHPAIRVVRADDGGRVTELDDGPGQGLWAMDFAPVHGDPRLLVLHERAGRPKPLVWDVATGLQRPIEIGIDGEIADADWFPDGRALLVAVDHDARTRLYRYDLSDGTLTPVSPESGTVAGGTARPDGDVWFSWSSAATPRTILSARTDRAVLTPIGAPAPPSVPVEDVWVDGPGGRIHALLRRPAGGVEPLPVIVEVHGGPTWHDSDSFAPDAAAWVDHGFAVLQVNYRGSTGYGSAWRDALEAKVGFTELEDVAAVHEHLVTRGVLDPDRSVLAGASWGGYLVLLGLGTQPDRWSLGLAGVPVADYVAAYEDEMDGLKAFDRSLFGGSPAEVPDAYRVSSPITYASAVRSPTLVLAGENDPRCPIRQIDNYVGALRGRSEAPPVEVYRYDAGHGSYADTERIKQMRAQLEFVRTHLG